MYYLAPNKFTLIRSAVEYEYIFPAENPLRRKIIKKKQINVYQMERINLWTIITLIWYNFWFCHIKIFVDRYYSDRGNNINNHVTLFNLALQFLFGTIYITILQVRIGNIKMVIIRSYILLIIHFLGSEKRTFEKMVDSTTLSMYWNM